MSGLAGRCAILCDFDGTVTIEEVSVALLKRYSGREWEEADRALLDGRTSLRETMSREFRLLRAPRAKLEDFARTVHLRGGFRELVEEARARGAPLVILSEGLDFYIKAFLDFHGIGVEFRTNHAVFTRNGICVEHPFESNECDHCGTCKKEQLLQFRRAGYTTVYIGDGISDRCPARYADLLLARNGLLDYCQNEGIKCVPYGDFYDVLRVLRSRFRG